MIDECLIIPLVLYLHRPAASVSVCVRGGSDGEGMCGRAVLVG